MSKIATLVMMIGFETGESNAPYATKSRHPKAFTNRNFCSEGIKNEMSTVAIAA
ncbi:hypothetical protein V8G61_06765 [Gaetbulibacter sp. M240]|uniref:hypothetical protein n=1 Tax=Gaetbulibacter sp. M240 TaxID=3126511 RepID=UPI00374F6CFE